MAACRPDSCSARIEVVTQRVTRMESSAGRQAGRARVIGTRVRSAAAAGLPAASQQAAARRPGRRPAWITVFAAARRPAAPAQAAWGRLRVGRGGGGGEGGCEGHAGGQDREQRAVRPHSQRSLPSHRAHAKPASPVSKAQHGPSPAPPPPQPAPKCLLIDTSSVMPLRRRVFTMKSRARA